MARRSAVLLLSSGRHPVSGRTRAADCDARALRMALRLQAEGWTLSAIHAGRPDDAALGQYLGMGLPSITVLGPMSEQDDAVPALMDAVSARTPILVLCGQTAEAGEGSGMMPYLLAQGLGAPVIDNVADIVCGGTAISVLQAEPAGRRRRYSLEGPAVLAVGSLAPAPPPFAYGRMRRGVIELERRSAEPDRDRAGWEVMPRRPRPARLRPAQTSATVPGKRALTDITPEAAALEIINFLKGINVLKDVAAFDGESRQAEAQEAHG
ncbi:hypothetical protein [Mesorhizobium sp.]|uniref:hypothetical protein n=1 Tax=Mesorhizobium sp. TaxID=1871066 RepID=UPI0035658492